MINLMVANRNGHKRYTNGTIETLINAQIENSRELGWNPKDIIILANFDYEFMGVKTVRADLNKSCLTGSKCYGVKWLFDHRRVDGVVWAHDLDAWQNIEFPAPRFDDVGLTYYSQPKYNGGSVFWKLTANDILYRIIVEIEKNKATREEPTLNRIFKSDEYKERVSLIDNTYNVGCSGFVPRYQRSMKPIHVCHFHPYNVIAWETHVLDRNGLGERTVNNRLERVLRKYYPNLATELSEKGKKRREELKLKWQSA